MPTTTKYIWDEQTYLAESDGTNTINVVYTNEPQQYGNLISSRISGTTSYHHFDALGSSRQLTGIAGGTTDNAIYDAWGNVANRTGSTAVMLLWIGEQGYYNEIETLLFHVRRRTYRPVAGLWTAVDPFAFARAAKPYVYSSNTPLNALDPSGLYFGKYTCPIAIWTPLVVTPPVPLPPTIPPLPPVPPVIPPPPPLPPVTLLWTCTYPTCTLLTCFWGACPAVQPPLTFTPKLTCTTPIFIIT
jgi:RHS repeat-associated protein